MHYGPHNRRSSPIRTLLILCAVISTVRTLEERTCVSIVLSRSLSAKNVVVMIDTVAVAAMVLEAAATEVAATEIVAPLLPTTLIVVAAMAEIAMAAAAMEPVVVAVMEMIVVEDMERIVVKEEAIVEEIAEDMEMIAVEVTETVAVDMIVPLATSIAPRTYFILKLEVPDANGAQTLVTFSVFPSSPVLLANLTNINALFACILLSPQQSEFALIVEGLGARPDWRDVKDHFRPMGANGHVAIRSNGQAIVPFDTEEALLSALKQAEGTSIRGSPITVTRQTREPRESRDAPSSSDPHGSPAARDAPDSPAAN